MHLQSLSTVKLCRQGEIRLDRGSSKKLALAFQLWLFFGSISVVAFSLMQQSPATIIAYILFGSGGLLVARSSGAIASHLFLLIYGFSVTAAVLLFYIYFARYGSPYPAGGSDDLAFESYARIIAERLWLYDAEEIGDLIDLPDHNSKGYIYLLSLFIRLGDFFGGFNTMIPRIFNCSLLGLGAVLSRSIARQIGMTAKQAQVVALWVGFFPMMVFVAIHVSRDILIAVLLLLTLKMALNISSRRDYIIPFLCSLAFLPLALAVSELRFLYLIPTTAMLAAAWFSRLWPHSRLRLYSIAMLAIALFLTTQILLANDSTMLKVAFQQLEAYGGQLITDSDRGAAEGLGSKLFSLPPPWQHLARFAYALVTPLPTYYSDLEWNFLGLGSLVQFFFATFVILGIKLVYRDTKYLPLFSGFAIIFFSYVMGSFIFRHITAWFPFAIIFGVIGYERYHHKRKSIFVVCAIVIGLAGFMYILLKM